jgi:hypothetical protein
MRRRDPCGYSPFTDRLAGLLLAGGARQPVIGFGPARLVSLEKTVERWQAIWIITPQIARIKSSV